MGLEILQILSCMTFSLFVTSTASMTSNKSCTDLCVPERLKLGRWWVVQLSREQSRCENNHDDCLVDELNRKNSSSGGCV